MINERSCFDTKVGDSEVRDLQEENKDNTIINSVISSFKSVNLNSSKAHKKKFHFLIQPGNQQIGKSFHGMIFNQRISVQFIVESGSRAYKQYLVRVSISGKELVITRNVTDVSVDATVSLFAKKVPHDVEDPIAHAETYKKMRNLYWYPKIIAFNKVTLLEKMMETSFFLARSIYLILMVLFGVMSSLLLQRKTIIK